MVTYRLRYIMLTLLLLMAVIAVYARATEDFTITYAWERFTQTDPPTAPVRPIAEFEPASQVLIRYPLGIPLSLVAQLSNTADVLCLVSSGSQQSSATNSFNNAGVNMDRVSFMIASTDSYWTRDYGPWFIYDGNGDYGVVDFQYNRPRPGDNMVPQLYADQFDLPYYGMNLNQTGGNYMTDGINTAAQTQIAYSENNNNQTNVNNLMHQYLGISSYHVLEDPNNTYIDHIDCWGKFLAPDKVIIRSVPSSHPQYSEIEATAQYFANLTSAWGYPYRVYRVNTPQNQPYTNSLILNKRVFVPIMNSPHDASALQVYAEAMPGYEIIGVIGSSYTPWESTDALHCRTHEIPDPEMLHISHNPIFGVVDYAESYPIAATIIPHSGEELIDAETNVVFKINSGEWQTSPLIQDNAYTYLANITGFAAGDTIRYYLDAEDMSGRERRHPEFAELDPHYFVIYEDTQGPVLEHFPACSIGEVETTFIITASDPSGIKDAWIEYSTDAGEVFSAKMQDAGNGIYLFTFLPDFNSQNQYFMYRFAAMDTQENVSWLPGENQWYSVAITHLSNEDPNQAPAVASLNLYPNPMKQGSRITASISGKRTGNLKAQIFNLKGQLVHEQNIPASENNMIWDGRDINGKSASSGIYFLKISGTSLVLNRKFIIVN